MAKRDGEDEQSEDEHVDAEAESVDARAARLIEEFLGQTSPNWKCTACGSVDWGIALAPDVAGIRLLAKSWDGKARVKKSMAAAVVICESCGLTTLFWWGAIRAWAVKKGIDLSFVPKGML